MTRAPLLYRTATHLPLFPLLHAPQVILCSASLCVGKAGAARGCPARTSSAQALAGHGTASTSELAEGSGAAAHVYVVAGEGLSEDTSSTGMK